MATAPPRPSFQFALSDLVWATLTAAAALGIPLSWRLATTDANGLSQRCPACNSELWTWTAPVTAAAVIGSAALALVLTYREGYHGAKKVAILILFPFLVATAFLVSQQRDLRFSRMRARTCERVAANDLKANAWFARYTCDSSKPGDHNLVGALYEPGDQTAPASSAEALRGIKPKSGYIFRALRTQVPGPRNRQGEALGDPRMAKDCALLACPYQYHRDGHNSFMISAAGIVYQNDLGPRTQEIFLQMTEFDPAAQGGWTPTE
jgi:hypothetical protein